MPRSIRAADSTIHPDFIQFQGDSSDAVIRGNVFLLKEEPTPGYPVQGIFLKDGVYNDILIEDNIVYTNTANGIYIESRPGGDNITIRENTVLSPPDITKFGFSRYPGYCRRWYLYGREQHRRPDRR